MSTFRANAPATFTKLSNIESTVKRRRVESPISNLQERCRRAIFCSLPDLRCNYNRFLLLAKPYGCPRENGYAESYQGRFRDEILGRELFYSVSQAKVLAEDWLVEYNHDRPHSSLDYRRPVQFAVAFRLRLSRGNTREKTLTTF
jgi:hypothetical protein